jgi:hypothetical protein
VSLLLASFFGELLLCFASIVHICTFITIVTVCLFRCVYLMASQKVSTSVTLAHFSNSTVCLSHSMGSWILDSGASDHVVGNPSLIYNLSPP